MNRQHEQIGEQVDTAVDAIKNHRIVVIYRGMQPQACLEVSEVLMEAGIRLFEVTMNSPDTAKALDLRGVRLSGDWDAYWQFHRNQQHARLYGTASSAPVTVELQVLQLAA